MTEPLTCSTSACPGLTTDELLRWARSLPCDGLELSLDRRLPSDTQRELLRGLPRDGARCVELERPAVRTTGQPAPSLASLDRAEGLAASRQIVATLELAHEHEVRRVVMLPSTMELSIPWTTLTHHFWRGEDSELEDSLQALAEERALRISPVMDSLCRWLDPAVSRAADLELELVLVTPTPYPHQIPDPVESAYLLEIFAGAPLRARLQTDWVLIDELLSFDTPLDPEGASPVPVTSLGLADACGLISALPLGTGESDWEEDLTRLDLGLPMVMTFCASTSSAELGDAVKMIRSWPQR